RRVVCDSDCLVLFVTEKTALALAGHRHCGATIWRAKSNILALTKGQPLHGLFVPQCRPISLSWPGRRAKVGHVSLDCVMGTQRHTEGHRSRLFGARRDFAFSPISAASQPFLLRALSLYERLAIGTCRVSANWLGLRRFQKS